MKYGYDKKTKCLFSWDGDFRYEGKTDVIPEDAFVVKEESRTWLEMAGCQFLSGYTRNVLMYHSNSDNSIAAYGDVLKESCKWTDCRDWKKVTEHIHPTASICISGYVASNPNELAEFCKTHPSNSVYVCPLVEELAAFGVLVMNIQDKEKPRKINLCIPNDKEMGDFFLKYEPTLNGDGYGKMADFINRGFPVLNEIMSCPGISPFYGRVLAEKSGKPSTYLLRKDAVGLFFPQEPLSATHYVATSVPVAVTNTTSFMRKSGCKDDKVNIVVSSDNIPWLKEFLNFYRVMSGKDFVGTTNLIQLRAQNLPVFRYSRAHNVKWNNEK